MNNPFRLKFLPDTRVGQRRQYQHSNVLAALGLRQSHDGDPSQQLRLGAELPNHVRDEHDPLRDQLELDGPNRGMARHHVRLRVHLAVIRVGFQQLVLCQRRPGPWLDNSL